MPNTTTSGKNKQLTISQIHNNFIYQSNWLRLKKQYRLNKTIKMSNTQTLKISTGLNFQLAIRGSKFDIYGCPFSTNQKQMPDFNEIGPVMMLDMQLGLKVSNTSTPRQQ